MWWYCFQWFLHNVIFMYLLNPRVNKLGQKGKCKRMWIYKERKCTLVKEMHGWEGFLYCIHFSVQTLEKINHALCLIFRTPYFIKKKSIFRQQEEIVRIIIKISHQYELDYNNARNGLNLNITSSMTNAILKKKKIGGRGMCF